MHAEYAGVLAEAMFEVSHRRASGISRQRCKQIISCVRAALREGNGVWHPNGFYKLTLKSDPINKSSLRVHLWPPTKYADENSNVHAHAWDFWSLLLGGRLRQSVFRESVHGSVVDKFYYESGSQTDIRFVDKTRIILADDKFINAGDVYHLEKGTLHRIDSVAKAGSATLVLTMDRQADSSITVLRQTGLATDHTQKMAVDALSLFDNIVGEHDHVS